MQPGRKVLVIWHLLSDDGGVRTALPNRFPGHLLYDRSCKMAVNKMDMVPVSHERERHLHRTPPQSIEAGGQSREGLRQEE